jgi:hypothetical protein
MQDTLHDFLAAQQLHMHVVHDHVSIRVQSFEGYLSQCGKQKKPL